MKKLLVAAAVLAVIFVGGYFAYTTWVSPRQATDAQSTGQLPANHPTQSAQAVPTGTIVMPTIVTAATNKDGIPESVSSLPLKSSQIGKDALDMLSKLHGEGFDLLNGYRGDYSNGTNNATLYVGQAKDAATATKLASEMADKIGTNNAMFSNLQELNISNRTIYEVNGQGQFHFFYAVNDKIVWLAVDSANAAEGLHSIWGAIK